MANHLRQPMFSFKKIIAKIYEKIGTAWEITVTSATEVSGKQERTLRFQLIQQDL